MGYENTSIHEVLSKMGDKSLLLPAFQRKLVWGPDRIEALMDSLMRGYPIGTFLLWDIEQKDYNEGEFVFYEFIRTYSEFDGYRNAIAPSTTDSQKVWAALDGQQRLTSLYIAFRGTYAMHKRNHSWEKRSSFPSKALYVNLLYDFSADSDNEGESAGFKFFEPEHVPEKTPDTLWFRVSDVSKYKTKEEVRTAARGLSESDKALDNLMDLWNLEYDDRILNYYRSTGKDIDDVLEIFVRVNSGAVTLSRSDLLLSTIVATWPQAREKFDDVLEEANSTGEGFRFSIDFIVRCTLACIGAPMQMRVRTFSKTNVESITSHWSKIQSAILAAVNLVSEFGFHARTLVAPNAVIPVVLYCFLNGKPNAKAREELERYLIIAQLNQIYGASADNALTKVNGCIREAGSDFSVEDLRGLEFSGRRSFKFTPEDIEGLLDYRAGSSYAFMVLSLLYPDPKTGLYTFHLDHMHPYSGFEDEKLKKMGLDDAAISDWRMKGDTIPNLHFLDAESNESKNATSLEKWMKANPVQAERVTSKYCDGIDSFEFADFDAFYSARRANMRKALTELLVG